MLTINGSDVGAERVVKHNENARRRLTFDVRTSADASTTQLSTDELLVISAATATRTLTLLPAATANNLYVRVSAASGGNPLVIEPDGAETIDGAANLSLTAAAKLLLVTDGTAWTVWTLT